MAGRKTLAKDDDLYEVVGCARDASSAEIRKQYMKKALQCHPDRMLGGDKDSSAAAFQRLSFAYTVLMDEERRKVYDESGIAIDDDSADWAEFMRVATKRVSAESLVAFEQEYRDSWEERSDIIRMYKEFEGDLDRIVDTVWFGSDDERERYRQIIECEIAAGNIPTFDKFLELNQRKQARRRLSARKEAEEAAELARELNINVGSNGDLVGLIQKRAHDRLEVLSENLLRKYGGLEAEKKSRREKTGRKRGAKRDSGRRTSAGRSKAIGKGN